ncbi:MULTISPECIES: TadE/TadG family type IV pilus assembly protein [unclassified Vibrio]|uniref:TadE/TadG family type IV pilus assembly protein n=1 Tax=Vibrio sp. HB236076 TaxID=3232307 RepID=A0AB39HFQ4_9VIBR|nr:TadE/TadG family type IV pilus assembly protein [Vibrio sp. HB161653]MDP5253169.1 TadE/TadG family type IV pilus assembly protein [Vibrio sp. HB161653]
MKTPSKFRQLGVTAVEFALGGMSLIFITLAVFEASYYIYVIDMVEYSLRETVRETKVSLSESEEIEDINQDYQNTFQSLIEDDSNLWGFLIDSDKFSFSGKYYQTYDNFINDIGSDYLKLNYTYDLAQMTVTYDYSPMVAAFGWQDRTISRTMVLNLEHQGWDDE